MLRSDLLKQTAKGMSMDELYGSIKTTIDMVDSDMPLLEDTKKELMKIIMILEDELIERRKKFVSRLKSV